MITVHQFTFGPFQENTYVLFDETNDCVIIDPGFYHSGERMQFVDFIENRKLNPVRLLNTHCHIDHVFGNKFISENYKLGLEINENDLKILQSLLQVARMYGLNAEKSPDPSGFLNEGDTVKFGNSILRILFTPGHSRGSVCFVSQSQEFVICGDVLFRESIGRTDLPGGDFNTLITSIKTKLFVLEDDYKVYPGHGPATSIGHEKKHNPFL